MKIKKKIKSLGLLGSRSFDFCVLCRKRVELFSFSMPPQHLIGLAVSSAGKGSARFHRRELAGRVMCDSCAHQMLKLIRVNFPKAKFMKSNVYP